MYLQIEGQTDEAIRQYERTVTLDENYTDAYLNLGRLAMYQGRPTDADHFFQELIKTPPLEGYAQHLEAYYQLVDLRIKALDPGMAKVFLEEMLLYDNPAYHVGAEGRRYIESARKLEPLINGVIGDVHSGRGAATSTVPSRSASSPLDGSTTPVPTASGR
ncbi:MAG: tetratricopeptide repeat protein [Pirellulales bacterium]